MAVWQPDSGQLHSAQSRMTEFPSQTLERRAWLSTRPFAIAESWNKPCVYERSVKFLPGRMLANRYMIAFACNQLSEVEIADACWQLSANRYVCESIVSQFTSAHLLLLGFEDDGQLGHFKIYLELKGHQESSDANEQTQLKHVGYKWRADSPGIARLARYYWYPQIVTNGQITERIAGKWPTMLDSSILSTILTFNPAQGDVDYIESEEPPSAREAFDLNVYRLGLQVSLLREACAQFANRLSIDSMAFEAWYALAHDKQLGHLSCGIDRRGEPFVTLYYQ